MTKNSTERIMSQRLLLLIHVLYFILSLLKDSFMEQTINQQIFLEPFLSTVHFSNNCLNYKLLG